MEELMKRIFLAVSLLLLLACGNAFANDNIVVLAKANDIKVTLADFKRLIGFYDADKQKIIEQSPDLKTGLLKRYVQTLVVSRIARDKGFDNRPDIKEQVNMVVNNFLAGEYLKKEVSDKISVKEDDVEAYYRSHKEEFTEPETVRARHILVKVEPSASEEDKKKAREKAEDILKKARAGEDFSRLASEFSDDPGSKAKGGDLGFFSKGRMVPEFEKAAFALKPGALSSIVETQFGFHIIKVEEKKESFLEPYDKVKDRIRDKALNQKRNAQISEFIEKAMKDAGVEFNMEPLSSKK